MLVPMEETSGSARMRAKYATTQKTAPKTRLSTARESPKKTMFKTGAQRERQPVDLAQQEPRAPLKTFVLPDGIYGEYKVFPHEDTADKTFPMPSYSKEYAGATVDKYGVHPITGERILVQRRVYDAQGFALQDFDYCHSRFRLHFFPHIHIWINRKTRSYAIEYR